MDLNRPSTSKGLSVSYSERRATAAEFNKNVGYNVPENFYCDKFDFQEAAKESRLKAGELSPLERVMFPNVNVENYICYRNFILKQWHNAPHIELVLESVIQKLDISDLAEIKLVTKIYKFLKRYCFINYGVFRIKRLPKTKLKIKVIIVGSGISGIAAARQLRYFGFDVTILEATKRVGGRLYSFSSDKFLIDLGSSFINCFSGNPIRTILNQIKLNVNTLQTNRKLFLDGDSVSKKKDKVTQNMFFNVLSMALHLCIKKNLNFVNNEQISLDAVIDQLLYFCEICSLMLACDFLTKKFNIEENINITIDQLEYVYDTFLKYSGGFNNKVSSNSEIVLDRNERGNDFDCSNDYSEEIIEQTDFSQILESHASYLKSIQLEDKYYDINKKLEDLESDKLKNLTEFLSPENSRILHWYFASLEYLLGAPLADISLRWFCKEVKLEHSNLQYYCCDSYSSILRALINQNVTLKIEKETQVRSIELFNDHVEIEAVMNGTSVQYKADAVLCTVPLGVLKKSIELETNELFHNKIKFKPPLPEDKVSAIRRLGFATINKVVLCFEKRFWETCNNMFGNVGLTKESRGELFLFLSLSDQPVLTGIICGKSLVEFDKVQDDIVVSRCLNILKEIFDNVPCPLLSSVSRWDSDPFFMGTHSFVSTKSQAEDYDVMAKPVCIADHLMPRLFFAGEHTHKDYPSSVHGAFLSGLREASKISNCFLGLSFNDN